MSLDIQRLRRLCELPFDEARPQAMTGMLDDPKCFFGESQLQELVRDPQIMPRAGLFRDQQMLSPAEYPAAYTPEGLPAFRAGGVSLTLRGVQRHAGPVRDVCIELAKAGSWPTVHAVAIETHRDVNALELHWDCNPVLVFQVDGRKHWEVFEPVIETDKDFFRVWDNRLGGRTFTEREWSRLQRGSAAYDVTLEPGDVLYVPMGWIHRAAAVDHGTPSLAVSVCPLPKIVFDTYGNEDHML